MSIALLATPVANLAKQAKGAGIPYAYGEVSDCSLLFATSGQGESPASNRCVISGCDSFTQAGDLVYCSDHRQQAENGALWGADLDEDFGLEPAHSASAAPDEVSSVSFGSELNAVLDAVKSGDAQLYVENGRLHYLGPRVQLDDPLLQLISEYQDILIELFTYAPNGRCLVDGCYRLRCQDGALTCPDHAGVDDDAGRQALPLTVEISARGGRR